MKTDYDNSPDHESSVDINDGVALIKDLPDKKLYKGYVCVVDSFAKDKKGNSAYLVWFQCGNILEMVITSDCIKLISWFFVKFYHT